MILLKQAASIIDIDKIIDEINEEIVDIICSEYYPRSVILKGSFGRNEPTYLINDDGTITFLSDYEIEIISVRYLMSRLLSANCGMISLKNEKIRLLDINLGGIKLSAYSLFPASYRFLDATMANYDLKYGSKTIYGNNYIENIKDFHPTDIPLWEGIKLIFNRIAEALYYFSIDNISNPPDKESENLFFWTNKIILACQDALLILKGYYDPSYERRNKVFQRIYPHNFKDLNEKIPHFLSLTVMATNYKLGSINKYIENIIDFWFEIVEICDLVLRYIMLEGLNIQFNSYIDFQKKLEHSISKRCIIKQNLICIAKIWIRHHKPPAIKFIRSVSIPWVYTVYSSILLIYFGISKNNVDQHMLKEANRTIELFQGFIPFSTQVIPLEWEYVKHELISLWSVICY